MLQCGWPRSERRTGASRVDGTPLRRDNRTGPAVSASGAQRRGHEAAIHVGERAVRRTDGLRQE